MTSKRKKIKNSQRQNTRKQSSKKQSIKIPTYEALGLGDDLSSVTSQEKGVFKNNKHKDFSQLPKKSKKRSKGFFVNCYAKPKKTKNPKNSLTQNLNKNVIPIASKQKTKKDKDSLVQNSKKTLIKKSSKHKSGKSNPVLSIIS